MRIPKYRKGMTLVELMIVIVIVGVLSLLAVTSYRKYTFQARSSEAKNFLGAIRVAQEAYYQSFGQYCGTTGESLWPAAMPQDDKVAWGDPIPLAWQHLGIKSPGYVQFRYGLAAGVVGEAYAGVHQDPFLEPPARPWFVATAMANFLRDDTGKETTFIITSESDSIYAENENY